MIDFVKIPKKRLDFIKDNYKELERLEDFTETQIDVSDIIEIKGDGLNVFKAKNIIKAFARGFSLEDAFDLLDDEKYLEIIELSDHAKSPQRMKIIKSRLIGTKGKAKRKIQEFTETKISIYGKTVSIIGNWEKLNISKEAILMLINGCSHTTLYKWLESKC